MSSHNGIVGRSPQTSIIAPGDPNFIVKANDNFSRLGQASNELQNVVNQILINNGGPGGGNVQTEWKRFDITAAMFSKAATSSDAITILSNPPSKSLMLYAYCYWHTDEAVVGPGNLSDYQVAINSSILVDSVNMFSADNGVTFHNATTPSSYMANNSTPLTLQATTTKSGGADINTNEVTGGHATILLLTYLLVFP